MEQGLYFAMQRHNEGNEKVKTIGKLLDEKITLEGMYTIVLKTNVSDGQYSFITQNSGKDTVKSPIGLFDSYAIDNDLKYVDEKIRNYYELGEFLTDEEIAEIDEQAKKVDLEPETKGKRSRSRGVTVKDGSAMTKSDAELRVETADTTPRRRSRAEVAESNADKVANANLDTDNEDGVPFDEVEVPEVEKLPRETASERKTRKDRNTKEEDKEENIPTDKPAEEVATPVRRRRRTE